MENVGSKNCLPSDKCTKDLDQFFANGLYNSYEATDELMKAVEETQDEALARRVLALYQSHYSSLERPWDQVSLIYGLGLIYMHFNAYNWAIKAFREAVYVQPSFDRSRDVHTRLGLIFKATGRYKLSEKHFRLALHDTRAQSGTSSRLELEFQLAHLLEVQNKSKQAKDAYEQLLQEKELPHQISANIHRQLGCMYFCNDVDASTKSNGRKQNMFNHMNAVSNSRIDTALNYLNTSYRTDSDPKTSYYLGRCFTNIGRFQDAFASYRSVIDRDESTADTWCSIGVLYHRQNQPTDALQAYIRAVQFDKQHTVTWLNLGILYESHNQFNDALKCYQHALRSTENGVDKPLLARIKYIQKQLTDIESSFGNSGKSKIGSDKLLCLEDLWNLESKTHSEASSNNNARAIKTATPIPQVPAQPESETPMEVEQQINGSSSSGLITKKIEKVTDSVNHCANKFQITDNESKVKISPETLATNQTIQINTTSSTNNVDMLDCKLEISPQSDSKPQSCESKDFSLNQVLTNGTSKDSGISSNSSTYADCALVPSQSTNNNVTTHISAEQVIEACKNSPKPRKIDVNLLNDGTKPPHPFPRPPPYPPLPKDMLFPSPSTMFVESKKDLAHKKIQENCQSSSISIVRNIASVLKLDLGLFSTKVLMESNPEEQVDVFSHPLYQASNEDTYDNTINQWACQRQQSTSTISRYASYQVASFRESLQEERESKLSGSKTSLNKESETDSNESASVQAKRSNINNPNSQSSSLAKTNDTPQVQQTTPNSSSKGSLIKNLKREPPKLSKIVKSANHIDLSDEKKWRPQLTELNKLPNFIKCVSAANILTHIGKPLIGINTTAMSMHVPGCRILGNRTSNNFCSVNINVGPGDYEWCAVPAEYGNILSRLCNRNGFELDGKDWWPKIGDLQAYNVPIYRFSQRPGDLVWVNSGTFYWVQSTGWCNSIHWNVGPLCAKQYTLASESIELNKLSFRKSDVPMIQLTWNIIMNINIIPDDDLCTSIVNVLRRSLKYCALVRDLLDEAKQQAQLANDDDDTELPGPKLAKYCSLCEIEIFNIYFIKKSDESINCVECARREDPTFNLFSIKQDYNMKHLMKLYDNFIEVRNKFRFREQAKHD